MIVKPERITPELMEMCKPSSGSKWHWSMNINAVLENGYCSECELIPVGCVREGCGKCKGHEDEKGYLATLEAKAKAYDEGTQQLAVYTGKGEFLWSDNYLNLREKADLPFGCSKVKVRVCKEEENEKGKE